MCQPPFDYFTGEYDMKTLFLSASLLFSATAFGNYWVDIYGSETLRPVFEQVISINGLDEEVMYGGQGSSVAESAILDMKQTIGPMSREFDKDALGKAKSQGISLVEHVIGLDAIRVLVNLDNKVGALDLDTVNKIFTCEITDWSEVAGSNLKGEICPFARDEKSGTSKVLKNVAAIPYFGDCVTIVKDIEEMQKETSADDLAIGFGSRSSETAETYAVMVAESEGEIAYAPSAENVRNHKYTLARKLFVYEAKGAAKASKAEHKLLKTIKDRKVMDKIIEANGFYTVD